MKRTYLMLMAGFCALAVSCSEKSLETGCIPSALQNGVIAFYPFSNGSLDDAAGNNDLTNNTGAFSAPDRDGNSNCAYEFDNTGSPPQFLERANPTFLDNLSSFSVSLWYLPLDSVPLWTHEVLLARDTGFRCPDGFGQWSLTLYDCRKPVFTHSQQSEWSEYASDCPLDSTVTVEPATGLWHHLAAVFNNGTLNIYVNGVLSPVSWPGAPCGPVTQDIGDLFIGKHFTGRLDDIIIYNRALNASEVGSLYELDGCCSQ